MSPARLNKRFGAQARIHGLSTQLARSYELTTGMPIDDEFDVGVMQAYCRDVVPVPNPYGHAGPAKWVLQLLSLASTRSFERLSVAVPELQSFAPGGLTW